MFRRKRRVRLQLEGRPGTQAPTIEGILTGCWGGHYVLIVPKVIQEADRSIALDGTVEVPRERVLFVQVMP